MMMVLVIVSMVMTVSFVVTDDAGRGDGRGVVCFSGDNSGNGGGD